MSAGARQMDGSAPRYGILGGTFDPPHIGHLILADQCRQCLALERVFVVPAGHPPHKDPRSVSPFHHRFEMARRAFGDEADIFVEDLEGDRRGPSYTIDTLNRLLRIWDPAVSPWLLLGSDSLSELDTWHKPDEIVARCRLAVYGRPGFRLAQVDGRWRPFVDPVEGPQVAISSTELRRMARRGSSLRFLVPEAVRRYIEAAGLYAGDARGED